MHLCQCEHCQLSHSVCWKLDALGCSKSHFPPAKHGLAFDSCAKRGARLRLGSADLKFWNVSRPGNTMRQNCDLASKTSWMKSMSWTPHHAATVLQALVNWHVWACRENWSRPHPTTCGSLWHRVIGLCCCFKYLRISSSYMEVTLNALNFEDFCLDFKFQFNGSQNFGVVESLQVINSRGSNPVCQCLSHVEHEHHWTPLGQLGSTACILVSSRSLEAKSLPMSCGLQGGKLRPCRKEQGRVLQSSARKSPFWWSRSLGFESSTWPNWLQIARLPEAPNTGAVSIFCMRSIVCCDVKDGNLSNCD